MSLFDEAQIAFLVLSVSLSLWKTWRLKKRNISVWVLARGEQRGARKAVEGLYLIGMLAWFALILLLATGNADQLPRFLGRPCNPGPWSHTGSTPTRETRSCSDFSSTQRPCG